MKQMCERVKNVALACIAVILSAGCGTTGNDFGGGNSPAEVGRRAQIKAEPVGDYYIGRRYHINRTRFWGYLRRPRQSWRTSKLVVMSERIKRSPDRLPEVDGGAGARFSYDHNYEYRIYGRYSGKEVYDPNSNLFLPEFILTDYQLISAEPGWLLKPNEIFNSSKLPFVPGR